MYTESGYGVTKQRWPQLWSQSHITFPKEVFSGKVSLRSKLSSSKDKIFAAVIWSSYIASDHCHFVKRKKRFYCIHGIKCKIISANILDTVQDECRMIVSKVKGRHFVQDSSIVYKKWVQFMDWTVADV